jgi:cobalt-zinc-cadmium resistance protein CzcA
VDATVDKVEHTIFAGIGLVLLVLMLFLGSPRSALIVGITIPFAMVIAFILMNLLRIPASLLSLGAIDFGIIVDGAIVMTDAIWRRRETRPDEPLTESDAILTAHQVARPIFFATPHHHYRLCAAVRVPADRGEAVLSHGICGRLCAAGSAAAGQWR